MVSRLTDKISKIMYVCFFFYREIAGAHSSQLVFKLVELLAEDFSSIKMPPQPRTSSAMILVQTIVQIHVQTIVQIPVQTIVQIHVQTIASLCTRLETGPWRILFIRG